MLKSFLSDHPITRCTDHPILHRFLLVLALLAVATVCPAQNLDAPQTYNIYNANFALLNPPQLVSSASVSLLDNPGPATYCYWIVANFTIGNSAPAGPFCNTNAPNTISTGIRISWAPALGAGTYDVLKTTNFTQPAGACGCAVTTATSSTSVTDTGAALNAYTVTTFDPGQAVMTMQNEPTAAGVSQLVIRFNGTKIFGLASNASNVAFASAFTPVAHQFLTGMNSGGVFSAAQPAFTDLSGTATSAQLPSPSSTFTGVQGNTGTVQMATGAATSGDLLNYDASGNAKDSGKATPTGAIVGTTDAQNLTNKTLTNAVINGGICKNSGTGCQHFRTTVTVSTAASSLAVITQALTLPVTEADTNYTVDCWLVNPNVQGAVSNSSAKSTTGFTVTLITFAAISLSSGEIDCIVLHD